MTTTDRECAAWQEHEREQRRRWRQLSAVERLRWLDDAKRFVANIASKKSNPQDERS